MGVDLFDLMMGQLTNHEKNANNILLECSLHFSLTHHEIHKSVDVVNSYLKKNYVTYFYLWALVMHMPNIREVTNELVT